MTTTTFAIIALGIAGLAVLGFLGAGLVTMMRGKDITGKQSNKLMWLRIYAQAAAVALFALVMILLKKNNG